MNVSRWSASQVCMRSQRTSSRALASGPGSRSASRSQPRHRRSRSHRARVLGKLLVLLDVYGPAKGPMAVSLRELLGVIGASQWRLKGVEVPALGSRIHPHYGVCAPIRGEYVNLVAHAPLPPATRRTPATSTAFDLGTGTGVLAAVLAHRGINRVLATDRPTSPGLRRGQRPPSRTDRPYRGIRPRPVPRRPRRPHRLQPTLAPRPSDQPPSSKASTTRTAPCSTASSLACRTTPGQAASAGSSCPTWQNTSNSGHVNNYSTPSRQYTSALPTRSTSSPRTHAQKT